MTTEANAESDNPSSRFVDFVERRMRVDGEPQPHCSRSGSFEPPTGVYQ